MLDLIFFCIVGKGTECLLREEYWLIRGFL